MLNISKNIKYLLFLGSGRTGSTLVGQLLNNHPEMLITNETRILQKSYKENKKISNYIESLAYTAYETMKKGTIQYDKIDKKDNQKRWQRDWTDSSKLSILEKKEIKYIGDKKQGGNTSLLIENKEKIINLIDIDFLPVTVVRDPAQVFKSYLILNNNIKSPSDGDFIEHMIAGIDYVKENKGIIINYNLLIEDVDYWCEDLCKKLNIENDLIWLTIVKDIVKFDKTHYIMTKDEQDYLYSLNNYENLVKKIKEK